jgi:hypothetical protein
MPEKHTMRAHLTVAALALTGSLGAAPHARAEVAEANATAAVEPAPAPAAPAAERRRQRIRLEDSDAHAHFELRDENGGLYECVGSCDLTAPEGRYHVRVAHGRSVDEGELVLASPVTIRGRRSSYVGIGLGVPMIVGGVLAGLIGAFVADRAGNCLDCTDAEAQRAKASAPGDRRGGYLVIGAGALAIAGGIYLITTSHGSSVTAEATADRTSRKSFAVGLVPSLGGASLAVAGSF